MYRLFKMNSLVLTRSIGFLYTSSETLDISSVEKIEVRIMKGDPNSFGRDSQSVRVVDLQPVSGEGTLRHSFPYLQDRSDRATLSGKGTLLSIWDNL